jgi:hypothetical protein
LSRLRFSRAAEEEGFGLETGSTMASGMWSFLQLAGTTLNMGAKPGRREEERWDE